MGTVVRVGHELPALEQGFDLLGAEPVAGLHRRLAGDHVQELGDQGVARGRNGLRVHVLGQVADQLLGCHVGQQHRGASDQHRVAAEVLNVQSKLGQKLAVLEDRGSLVGTQMHRLGDEQPLRFCLAGGHPLTQFFVENSLVQARAGR